MATRKRKVLLPGPVLLGFGEIFDRSYGDPRTKKPYMRVTPSTVGGVLLPFECPHCGEVRAAVIDRKTRLGYADKERGFSWCPACQGRYVIKPEGTPLIGELPAGAAHAPALIERGGKREVIGLHAKNEEALTALGAEAV